MRQQTPSRRRSGRRLAVAILAGALVAGVSGCGSRASDEAIAESLRGGAPAALAGQAPTAESGLNSQAASQPGAAPAKSAYDTNSGSGVPASNPGTKAGASGVGGGAAAAATKPGTARGGAHAAGTATKSVVKIGTLGPFSGLFGAVFGDIPRAVNVWAAAQNARGGVNGHPVQVIVADNQADPPTALTLAKRMVENDHIIAMVANMNIFAFDQIEKYMREKNVPLIGGDAVAPGWFTSPVAFPVTPPVATQVISGLEQLVDQGATKLAIAYCLEVSALCTYLSDQVQKSEVGPKVVQTYQVSLVAPSYTSQCLRMKAGGVDVMYLVMDTAGANRLVRDCAAQDFKPKVLMNSLTSTSDMPDIPALAQSTLVVSGTFPPVDLGLPEVSRYLHAMSTYAQNIAQSGATTFGWSAGEMFGLAAKHLSDDPSSTELFAALWKVRNETLGGLIAPTSYVKGKHPQVKSCIFVYGMADGRWTAPNGAKLAC